MKRCIVSVSFIGLFFISCSTLSFQDARAVKPHKYLPAEAADLPYDQAVRIYAGQLAEWIMSVDRKSTGIGYAGMDQVIQTTPGVHEISYRYKFSTLSREGLDTRVFRMTFEPGCTYRFRIGGAGIRFWLECDKTVDGKTIEKVRLGEWWL